MWQKFLTWLYANEIDEQKQLKYETEVNAGYRVMQRQLKNQPLTYEQVEKELASIREFETDADDAMKGAHKALIEERQRLAAEKAVFEKMKADVKVDCDNGLVVCH